MDATWEPRDLPVLDAVVRHFDEHPEATRLTLQEVAQLASRDVMDVYRALKELSPTYIKLQDLWGGQPDALVWGVTDDARRAVGQWPSPDVWVDRLVQALREAAEREPDPERRSRLRAMAEGLGGFARDVAVGVLSGGITQSMGNS
jgi:hypothetical protein